MTLDLTKPVQTRDGRAVRIYATDGGGEYPVHGAVWSARLNRWVPEFWTHVGSYPYFAEALAVDLINCPPPKLKVEYWLNVYHSERLELVIAYLTRTRADQAADADRAACLHIVQEYTEGEGL